MANVIEKKGLLWLNKASQRGMEREQGPNSAPVLFLLHNRLKRKINANINLGTYSYQLKVKTKKIALQDTLIVSL